MPQEILPIFPSSATQISEMISVEKQSGQVVYYHGLLPIFTHAEGDVASFRFFTTQLIENGNVTNGQIQRAFGIAKVTVTRCLKRYRQRGAKAFFEQTKRVRCCRLDEAKSALARRLLEEGKTVAEVSAETGVLKDTIRKAIYAGRLPAVVKKKKASRRV